VIVFVLIAAAAAIKLFSPGSSSPPPTGQTRSLAVLPLENFSGDPNQEYFADGMTDELITELANISGLTVISRTSVMRYKGDQKDPLPQIAKALNVTMVVEGSVTRIGDTVRMTIQLIDAATDKNLWAKSYESESKDVLKLQANLASEIARQIRVEITPEERARLADAQSVNPEAHEAYLRGLYYVDQSDPNAMVSAQKFFARAIELDPTFAPAYAGLAQVYILGALVGPPSEVMPLARAAAQKAVELDDNLAEAHCSLATVKFQHDADWAGSSFWRCQRIDRNSRVCARFEIKRGPGERLRQRRSRESGETYPGAIYLGPRVIALDSSKGNKQPRSAQRVDVELSRDLKMSLTRNRSVSRARRWIEAFRLSTSCELIVGCARTRSMAASEFRASRSSTAKNA